jgi:ATP-dependent Clp protease ATP-binding subunit ClpA
MATQGYNFTERVRRLLARAREVAYEMRHEYVGTEHLLIAVAEETHGPAASVLESLGAQRDDIITRVRQVVTMGNSDRRVGPEFPYTSRAKKVLELTMAEARLLGHDYVGVEHLLLGIIAEQRVSARRCCTRSVSRSSAREPDPQACRIAGVATAPTEQFVAQAAAPGYARSQPVWRGARGYSPAARVMRAAYSEAHSRDHGAVDLSRVALASRDDGMAVVILDQVVGSRSASSRRWWSGCLAERAERKSLQLSSDTQALDNAARGEQGRAPSSRDAAHTARAPDALPLACRGVRASHSRRKPPGGDEGE